MTDHDLHPTASPADTPGPTPDGGAVPAETISVSFGDHPSYPPISATSLLKPGDRCGPYTIKYLIGQGGMAAVYLAERADEIQRKVALKVLSCWTPKRNDLFQSECQFLASLEHPGIARLYDAGTHVQGQPWMAMEYVDGEALDSYLQRVNPDLDTRLRIFTQLADALSHAHQQMIIHRDLKPSNILVTREGNPILLDFGIASTLDPGTGEQEGLTLVNERIMTPQYASPEQVNGRRLSAASDVYSLGLILYEMVTGQKAYELDGRNIAEVLHIVNNEPITKPSERRVKNTGRRIAYVGRLRGDLDTIVLKALEREPRARYVSVEAMVADVRRYLSGLPIKARPASRFYRMRKFVCRNPWPTLTTAMLVALAIGFTFYARYQNQRVKAERDVARQEQRSAEAVTQFMVGLFERVDPNVTKGQDVRAADLLEGGMQQIATDLDQEPRVKQALLQTMGRVHASLGEYGRAAGLFKQARALVGDDTAGYTELCEHLVGALIKKGAYAEAHNELAEGERWFKTRSLPLPAKLVKLRGDTSVETGRFVAAAKAYDRVWASGNLSDDETISLKFAQARLYEMWGFTNRGISLYEQVVAAKKAKHGFLHSEVADSLFALANAQANMGRYQAAETLFAEVAEILQTLYAPDHVRYAQLLQGRAFNFFRLGEKEKSRALFEQAVRIYEGLGDPNHPEYAMCLNKQGVLLRDQGDDPGSERLYRRSLTMFQESCGDSHPNTLTAQYNLALAFRELGRESDCDNLLSDGLKKAGRNLGEHHHLFATFLYSTAVGHRRAKRYEASYEIGQRVVAIRRRALGDRHHRTVDAVAFVSRRLNDLGRFPEAVVAAREAVVLSERSDMIRHRHTWRFKRHLALVLSKTGRFEEALALQNAVTEEIRREEADTFSQNFFNTLNTGEIYQWSHQWAASNQSFRALMDLVAAEKGTEHSRFSGARFNLAYNLRELKDWEASEQAYRAEIAYRTKKHGHDSTSVSHAFHHLGLMKMQQGDYAASAQLIGEAIAIYRRLDKPNHEMTGLLANHALAVMFGQKEKADGATLTEVITLAEQMRDGRSMFFGNWLFWRVEKLVQHGHFAYAKHYAERLVRIYEEQELVPTYRVIQVKAFLGMIAASEGDAEGMARNFEAAHALVTRDFGGPDHWLGQEAKAYQQEARVLLAQAEAAVKVGEP